MIKELTNKQIKQIEELTGLEYNYNKDLKDVFNDKWETRNLRIRKTPFGNFISLYNFDGDAEEMNIKWLIPLGKILEGDK